MSKLCTIGACTLALLAPLAAAEAGCDQARAAAALLRVQGDGAFAKRDFVNGRVTYRWSASYAKPNRLMTALLVSDAEACLSGQRIVVEFYQPDGTLFARSTPDGAHPIAMR